MKKIVCQACRNRYGDHGTWVVFNTIIICDSCRLRTIDWFKEQGLGLGHPFVKEFMQVTR